MDDNFKYEVVTTPSIDGKILQETYCLHDGIRDRIARCIVDTQEHQLVKALIKFGWTPPREKLVYQDDEYQTKEQKVRSDWQRMTNPKCAEDYGVRVNLHDLELYAPDILVNEIAPVLNSQFGDKNV